ncbi:MAG TPA: HAD-IIIC family phosphatase [Allosphingosinicella sp.]|jgi:FkbH-like protein
MTRRISVRFAGDVVTRPIGRIGAGLPDLELDITHDDIDQIYQALAGDGDGTDVLILHLSSDFFLDEAAGQEAVARMDAYCRAVGEFAGRSSTIVIVNTLEFWPARLVGLKHVDELALLASLNEKIFELARARPNVSVLDVGGIVAAIGTSRALSLQNRLAMRVPYTKAALDEIRAGYEQCVRERYAPRKKVVVLDADNTLWGGIVGEDGVDGIAIDKQYPGSIYRRFQSQLRDLADTGILLALASKNNPEDVREVFERREMPLRLEHFSSVQVNWEPKSGNIAKVAEDLNVGLDSLIFIDDNPFELEQVRAALPMVDVYRFDGERVDEALGLIASIDGLKTWSVTSEDRGKAAQYRQQKQRAAALDQATSLEDYLESLDMRLEIGRNRRAQVKRIAQLTNKTNQFNLTTRRYSEIDIARLMERGAVFDVRLEDRFGDMGVIGVVIVADRAIDTFLLSCRALGRGVESQILDHVCRAVGGDGLRASYLPSKKNMMTAEFFDANGFEIVARDADGSKSYLYAGGPSLSRGMPIVEVE